MFQSAHPLAMSTEEDTNVHDLLNTLLVPTYPPNRSQWKKLELALKFINLSKQSAKESNSSSDAKNTKRNTKAVSHGPSQAHHREPSAKKPRMMMTEPCQAVSIVHKDESSWTKIKDSVQHML